MRDPFFAQLMFLIEQTICNADRDAKEQGVILKDSQVQSALAKARGLAAGKAPKIEESTAAERILKELVLSICHAPQALAAQSLDAEGPRQEEPLRTADWNLAIEAVVDSIKTRRSEIPGSRDYLDFLRDFTTAWCRRPTRG